MFIEEGECVIECHTGYYGNLETSTCDDCHEGCLNCKSIERCRECDPVGYELNYLQKCQKCSDNCVSCKEEECLVCDENYFLEDSVCVDTCQDAWFGADGVCSACPAGCTVCESMTHCSGCEDGFSINDANLCDGCDVRCEVCEASLCTMCKGELIIGLEGNTCVDECGEHNFIDYEHNKCETCPDECSDCDSLDFCTECKRGF